MKELSIFIDESGDFGDYDFRSPYYIVSFVFHNQDNNITNNVSKLNYTISKFNINNSCIHTAPLIRGEDEYQNIDLHTRRKVLNTFFAFLKNIKITYKSFHIEKKHIDSDIELTSKLSKEIANFIKNNLIYFQNFDRIKIYYDNGQIELTKIIVSLFNALFFDVEFIKVTPSNYKLFQAADLFCYFTLAELKYKNKSLTSSEINFFETQRKLYRNYIRQVNDYKFK